uniref:Ig-like domain-containing protein n=1 Tax=Neogobius melanostomus TaxID=47308 RepID=A0A8C6U1A9_9GOBI
MCTLTTSCHVLCVVEILRPFTQLYVFCVRWMYHLHFKTSVLCLSCPISCHVLFVKPFVKPSISPVPEGDGDLYFTAKLQNYTAVEKEEVILMCELSKASGEVKWFKDGNEIYPSKNVLFQSDGKKRMLVIKKTAKSDMAAYTCDCGTDKTTAELSIEGNTCDAYL